jgi:hypothetical protein
LIDFVFVGKIRFVIAAKWIYVALSFKEFRMTHTLTTNGHDVEANGKVSLEVLAKMTGFPIEMIKEEIFKGDASDQVTLEDLRSAMLSYIDSTMLISDEK